MCHSYPSLESHNKKSMVRDRIDIVKYLNTLEQRALCMDDAKKINNWFKNLVNQDNSVMMQVTEKAKTTTLYHIVVTYNLNTRGEELGRPKMISLVRKEINRQKKQQETTQEQNGLHKNNSNR